MAEEPLKQAGRNEEVGLLGKGRDEEVGLVKAELFDLITTQANLQNQFNNLEKQKQALYTKLNDLQKK